MRRTAAPGDAVGRELPLRVVDSSVERAVCGNAAEVGRAESAQSDAADREDIASDAPLHCTALPRGDRGAQSATEAAGGAPLSARRRMPARRAARLRTKMETSSSSPELLSSELLPDSTDSREPAVVARVDDGRGGGGGCDDDGGDRAGAKSPAHVTLDRCVAGTLPLPTRWSDAIGDALRADRSDEVSDRCSGGPGDTGGTALVGMTNGEHTTTGRDALVARASKAPPAAELAAVELSRSGCVHGSPATLPCGLCASVNTNADADVGRAGRGRRGFRYMRTRRRRKRDVSSVDAVGAGVGSSLRTLRALRALYALPGGDPERWATDCCARGVCCSARRVRKPAGPAAGTITDAEWWAADDEDGAVAAGDLPELPVAGSRGSSLELSPLPSSHVSSELPDAPSEAGDGSLPASVGGRCGGRRSAKMRARRRRGNVGGGGGGRSR